jgi:hypothetical protein
MTNNETKPSAHFALHLRRNCLYASGRPETIGKPVHRLAQRQQIGGAERGPACRRETELIHRVDIGERAGDRAKPPAVTRVDHPVLAPVTAPADHLEHPAVEWMKRMRDPHLEAGCTNTACS